MRLVGASGGVEIGSECSEQVRCLWDATWADMLFPSLEPGGQADAGVARSLGRVQQAP